MLRNAILFLIEAASGDISGMQERLESGVDINVADSSCGETALHKVARVGNTEAGEFLLQHSDIVIDAIDDKFGSTPLHLSVLNGKFEMTEMLLEYGASPGIQDKSGHIPLYWAASEGNENMVILLLEYQSPVDVASAEGLTPLGIAVRNWEYSTCSKLLQYGANSILCGIDASMNSEFMDAARIANDVLVHNRNSILKTVCYSVALSKQCIPFEIVRVITDYYSDCYFWTKFDTQTVEALQGVVFPKQMQIPSIISSNEEKNMGSSNAIAEVVVSDDRTDTECSAALSTDTNVDSNADQEEIIVEDASLQRRSNINGVAREEISTMVLRDILEWVGRLPVWLQQYMVHFHIIDRLLELADTDVSINLIGSRDNFETQKMLLNREEIIGEDSEHAMLADYIAEYKAYVDGPIVDTFFSDLIPSMMIHEYNCHL
ncbi:hypothetical protein EDM53_03990 [Rickettsiales endosymbiont of Peranema trichophorum]|uniref:ankyrin repeat domain-containing protein n=1 Tax=Rickettsiales endosymbiont of Peranema trichophorum TaxID=2486577 RepID=UPI00102378BB|nr:ankyrin repeat domain-containing protein [Rickettsiales endosymbiont of Peranema trichophorum]RZI46355.1 hypothetical protein EDM53_03990 [Rickettsiales endosymbiont of Peranema trichophorum]